MCGSREGEMMVVSSEGLKSCLTCLVLNQKVEHFKQCTHYIRIDACSHYKLRRYNS